MQVLPAAPDLSDVVLQKKIFKIASAYPTQGDSSVGEFNGQYRGYYPGGGNTWRPTSSTFGYTRTYKNGKPKLHSGIDIYAPVGTPIFAPMAGRLRQKTEYSDKDKTKMGGLGRYVEIEFDAIGKTWLLLFGHLARFEGKNRVISAKEAEAGHIIGYVGASGNATAASNDAGISASHIHVVLQQKIKPFAAKKKTRVDPAAAFGWKIDPVEEEPGSLKIAEARVSWIISSPLKTARRLKAPGETGLPEVQIPIRFDGQAEYYRDVVDALEIDSGFKIAQAWKTDTQARAAVFRARLVAMQDTKNDQTFYETLLHANNLIKLLLVGGAVATLLVPAAAIGGTASALLGLGGLIYGVTGDVLVNALQVTYERRRGEDPNPIYSILGVPTDSGDDLTRTGASMPAVFSRAVGEEVLETSGQIVFKRGLVVVGAVADLWAIRGSTVDRWRSNKAFDQRLEAMVQNVDALNAALEEIEGGNAGINALLIAQAKGNARFFEEQDAFFNQLLDPVGFRPANYVLMRGN